MPAITLGLAEIEERLQVLRRRLNTATVLHAAFLSLSTVFLVAAMLVAVGLRGDAASFRAVTWSGVVLVAGAVVGCAIVVCRRWLDEPATAELVDQRGQLTDRLTTLDDLRRRPRPSRLAPVLIAQTLALGERWRPQRIVPRRVPRSVFLALLSLLALTASPLVAPVPPPPAPALQPSKSLAPSPSGTQDAAVPASAALIGKGGSAGDVTGGNAPLPAGEFPAPQMRPGPPARQPLSSEESVPDTTSAMLPDRLRNALRSALHAEQTGHPRDLAQGAQGESREHAPSAADDRSGATPDGAPRRRPGEAGKSAPERDAGAPARQPSGDAKADGPPQPATNAALDQGRSASAPNAGSGSHPENLLGAGAAGAGTEPAHGRATSFKLTITSFLHTVEEQNTQPRPTGKRGGSVAAAPDTGEAVPALNEQQLRDDALRKAEIPPEYEDIVRRVYSSRAVDVQDSLPMNPVSFGAVASDPTGSGAPKGRRAQPQ